MLKILILPINVSKMGISAPKVCISKKKSCDQNIPISLNLEIKQPRLTFAVTRPLFKAGSAES